jgi:argininosuccinate lyase
MRVIGFDAGAMRVAASDPALIATDVADLLVVHGIPFREAHRIVGRAVRAANKAHLSIDSLEPQTWQTIDTRIDGDLAEQIAALFDPVESLGRRNVAGGPGPRAVQRQLARAAALIAKTRRLVPVLAGTAGRAREVGADTRRG